MKLVLTDNRPLYKQAVHGFVLSAFILFWSIVAYAAVNFVILIFRSSEFGAALVITMSIVALLAGIFFLDEWSKS